MTDPADISAETEVIPPESSVKRAKKPSLKILNQDEPSVSKLQKMVLNDDLLTFIGGVIQGDPDVW